MSAVTGQGQARPLSDQDRIRQAVTLRDEWLATALSTCPADRDQAEAAVSDLYRLIHLPPPSFEWAPSPAAAVAIVRADKEAFPVIPVREAVTRQDHPHVRLASLVGDMRKRLDRSARRAVESAWPGRGVVNALMYDSEEAIEAGIGFDDVFEVAVYRSLRATLRDAITAPLRTALAAEAGDVGNRDGVAIGRPWFGQHEAHWAAHYDIRRRLGMSGPRDDQRQLETWVRLARSAGWWWPGDGRCVLAERPVALHTEPSPDDRHGRLRLHHADGRAIGFGDGYGIHVLHGTPVPEWVINAPTADLINRERNVEVRRSAIERMGWDVYLHQAALSLVAACPDPGNPGAELALYGDLAGSGGEQVLFVVNGTPEPDGRRRYGINVPAIFDDPVQAVGWTYGLSGTQYRMLSRRT